MEPLMEEIRLRNSNESIEKLVRLCSRGKTEQVVEMVNQGAPVNCYDYFGETPLHHACLKSRYWVVSLLILKGADVNAVSLNTYKETPLFNACNGTNVNIVKDLIEKGADVNHENFQKQTPIFECVISGEDILKVLIKHGADVNHKDEEGFTPLDHARRYNYYPNIVKILEEHSAKLE